LDEAKFLLEESLAIHKKLFVGGHPDVASSLNNLANMYLDQGKLDEAKLLYEESLKLFDDIADSYNLASVYLDQKVG